MLRLGGSNPFSGGVTLQSGTLMIGHDQALGSGELVVAGGMIQADGGARTLGNGMRLEGDVRFAGNQALRIDGVTQLSGQRALQIDNATTLGSGLTETQAGSGLIKRGSGTLVLEGASTLSGPTRVAEGRLVVNNASGSATGSGAVSVAYGGKLSGRGTLAGALTLESGGLLAPGNSPGSLNVGNTTWEGGAGYEWELNDVDAGAGTGWDLLNVTGTLMLSASSESRFNLMITSLTLGNLAGSVHDFDAGSSYNWVIASTTGGVVGFDPSKFNLQTSSFLNPHPGVFSVSLLGNDVLLHFTPVPEPATTALACGLSLACFALWRTRRKS